MKISVINNKNVSFKGFKREKKDDRTTDYKFYVPKTEANKEVYVEFIALDKKNEEWFPAKATPIAEKMEENENSKYLEYSFNSKDIHKKLISDLPIDSQNFGYRFYILNKNGEKEYFLDPGLHTNRLNTSNAAKYNIVNTNRPIVNRAGVGQLIMTDIYNAATNPITQDKSKRYSTFLKKELGIDAKSLSDEEYNDVIRKSMVRTHVNKYGGNLLGIAAKAKDLAEVEHVRTVVGMPFTKDTMSSHKYWTQNPFIISPDIGSLDDYKKMQIELFKNGINYCIDAALVNEGVTGARFQHALKWREASPFYTCFSMDKDISLALLPDNLEHCALRIVNSPFARNDNGKKSYNVTEPCYVQFYDTRLLDKEQLQNDKKLIDEYDYPNTPDKYEISTFYDTTPPYYFEVRSVELAEILKNAKAHGAASKSQTIFTYKNNPDAFNFISNALNVSNKRHPEGINLWDGNVDIPKAKFFIRPDDIEKASVLGAFQEEDGKNRASKLLEGIAIVQDTAIQAMEYWSDETRKTHLNYIASLFTPSKYGHYSLKSLKTQIENNISSGNLPETLYDVYPDGSKKLKLSDELLTSIINESYNSPIKKTNQLVGKKLEDVTGKLLTTQKFQTYDCQNDLAAVLASPYISTVAFHENFIGTANGRFEEYQKDIWGNKRSDEYYETYRKVSKLLIEDANELLIKLIKNCEKQINGKLVDEKGNVTKLGSYIIPNITDEFFKYYLNASFADDSTCVYNSDLDQFIYPKQEILPSLYHNMPLKDTDDFRDVKNEAEVVYQKLSNGIEKLKKNDDYISQLQTGLVKRYNSVTPANFLLADAIVDKTEAGLGIRIDAAKDVAEYDDVRTGRITPDKAWENVQSFWNKVTDKMLEINPHTLSYAEITDLHEFNHVKFQNGDAATAGFMEKITSPADYTYFFSRLANYAAGEAHEGTGREQRYNNLGNLQSFYDAMVNGWDTSAGKIYEMPIDGVNNSYVFANNHDKPRILTLMALDMELFHSNFKNPHHQRIAAELFNTPAHNIDTYKYISPKALAVGNVYFDAIKTVARYNPTYSHLFDDKEFIENIRKAVCYYVAGQINNSIDLLTDESQLEKTQNETFKEFNKRIMAQKKMKKEAFKRGEAFGVRSFEITLPEVIKKLYELDNGKHFKNTQELKLFEKAVAEELHAPAFDKYLSMYKTMICLPGVPVDFAGDRLGATGYETYAKNVYQANRHMVGWTHLKENNNIFKKLYKTTNDIAKLRTEPELSALNDGMPVVLPQKFISPVTGDSRITLETSSGEKDYSLMSILRYNDKGSIVITAFTNVGLQSHTEYIPNVNDKPHSHFVRTKVNRSEVEIGASTKDENGQKEEALEVRGIMITPEDLRQDNPKSGLKTGLPEGMVFRKYGDKETKYIIRNKQYAFPKIGPARLLQPNEKPNSDEVVKIYSELVKEDGTPITIAPEDYNVAVFYAEPQKNE